MQTFTGFQNSRRQSIECNNEQNSFPLYVASCVRNLSLLKLILSREQENNMTIIDMFGSHFKEVSKYIVLSKLITVMHGLAGTKFSASGNLTSTRKVKRGAKGIDSRGGEV